MPKTIREYRPSDAGGVKTIFIQKARRTEFRRTVTAVFYHGAARRTWQAGIVGIFGLQLKLMLTHQKVALAMFLWSTGVGLGWFGWFRSQDRKRVLNEYSTMADRFKKLQRNSSGMSGADDDNKNHVWVMEEERADRLGHKAIVGVVGFEYDEEDQEGRIWNLTGVELRTELALVKTAIQFARGHQINVLAEIVSPETTTFSLQ